MPPNTCCLPSPLCRRHLSVRDRSKGGFCCQKTPAWCQLNGGLVWDWNIEINEVKTQGIYFSRSLRPPESHLTMNGRNITFVNSVKYISVIFDKKVTWRLHIEMIEAKAFRTFIRIYSVFKSERLSTNIKLTLHKALIRSIMTYECPAWEFTADSHLLKFQRLQNKVFRTIWNFPRRTPARGLYMAFKLLYIYDDITKSCRQQAEFIKIMKLQFSKLWTSRTPTQGFKLCGGPAYDRSSD
jgi:hypothetical protein